MIPFYKNFLSSIYSILESMEIGLIEQTNETRAFNVVIIISFLELINIMSFFSAIKGKLIIIPLIVLLLVNYMFFLYNSRYKKIVNSAQSNKLLSMYKWIFIVYVCFTILYMYSKN